MHLSKCFDKIQLIIFIGYEDKIVKKIKKNNWNYGELILKKDDNNKEIFKNLTLISQIGISMITPILLGVFIGQLLDQWLGTESFFVITLIILGAGAGFMNLFKITGAWKNKRKWTCEQWDYNKDF